MIKKVLSTLFKREQVTEIPGWTEVKEKIECAIDDEIIDCVELEAPVYECGPGHFSHGYSPYGSISEENRYIGVPAPAYLTDDPWFGPAPVLTEKQMDYMAQETEIKMAEEMEHSEVTCESHDIHAKMYEIATKNWTTVAETQGGSENFQEGPGGWNSGTGLGQF